MSHIPSELKYATSHEWIRVEANGEAVVGISEHAQALLGDMVFVELPSVGKQVSVGDDCAVAESVKAASDIYSPVSGEIIAVNDALEESPELVNSDPYDAGWLFRIKLDDESELANLLDAQGYQQVVDNE
ncbi:MAG: glycine cleavage system protein GcvH [Aeromonas sp.]